MEQSRTKASRLDELLQRNAAGGVRLAYLITGNRALAEDLVQDAFVQLAGRLVHLRDPDNLEAYLRRTIVNLANAHFRRRKLERRCLEREAALPEVAQSGPEDSPNAPTWSPDGTRIAYLSTPGTPGAFVEQVWVVNADGTEKARLYESPCCIDSWGSPAWSPDGRSIAFRGSGGIPQPAVYVIGVDGSGLHRLPGFGWGEPVWKLPLEGRAEQHELGGGTTW